MKKRTLKECEDIIGEMTACLIFATKFWKYDGGIVIGINKTPIYWFADALEKVGITFEKDYLEALHGNKKERQKYSREKLKNKRKLQLTNKGVK